MSHTNFISLNRCDKKNNNNKKKKRHKLELKTVGCLDHDKTFLYLHNKNSVDVRSKTKHLKVSVVV